MFADTPSNQAFVPSVKKPTWSLVSRLFRVLVSRRGARSTDHLTDAHYRDLGLPPRRHDGADIRPRIVLGPM